MEIRKLMGEIGSRAWGLGRVLVVVGGVLGVGSGGARAVIVNGPVEVEGPTGQSQVAPAPDPDPQLLEIARSSRSNWWSWLEVVWQRYEATATRTAEAANGPRGDREVAQ